MGRGNGCQPLTLGARFDLQSRLRVLERRTRSDCPRLPLLVGGRALRSIRTLAVGQKTIVVGRYPGHVSVCRVVIQSSNRVCDPINGFLVLRAIHWWGHARGSSNIYSYSGKWKYALSFRRRHPVFLPTVGLLECVSSFGPVFWPTARRAPLPPRTGHGAVGGPTRD